jgi:hypothetical protein
MSDQFGPSKQTCLLNGEARCECIWVSQSDGLRLSHFQSVEKEKSQQNECDAASDTENTQVSDFAAYQNCMRGCVGPR